MQNMGGGPAAGPPLEEDMIGAIKIKDGLFIGDEFAAQVKKTYQFNILNFKIGLRICGC
jgi:hypothetical protein